MEPKRTALVIDLVFCGLILPLIILLLPVDRWIVKFPYFATMLVAFLYVLYYAVRRFHLPALFLHRRYGAGILFVAAVLTMAHLLAQFPFETPSFHVPDHVRADVRARTVWLLILVVLGFSLAVELLLELFRQILLRTGAEAGRQRAELALYKAQINPHFLFNTLNAIYGLVIDRSDRAERAVAMYGDLLQYMYRHAAADTVALADEVDYISHYIELQSLRLNSHTRVTWHPDIDDPQTQVPPMMLITFVENAFKHGSSPTTDCEILLRLTLRDGLLSFHSENALMRRPSAADDAPHVGIDNCRSRLEMLYPGRFSLKAAPSGALFKVTLTIRLS